MDDSQGPEVPPAYGCARTAQPYAGGGTERDRRLRPPAKGSWSLGTRLVYRTIIIKAQLKLQPSLYRCSHMAEIEFQHNPAGIGGLRIPFLARRGLRIGIRRAMLIGVLTALLVRPSAACSDEPYSQTSTPVGERFMISLASN